MDLELDDTERPALAELLRAEIERDRFPISLCLKIRLGIIPAILAMAVIPSLVAAQTLTGCELGQSVDERGIPGTIIGEYHGLCLIKYKDGQTQRWIAAKDLTAS